MKTRVLIWDAMGYSPEWLATEARTDHIQVVQSIMLATAGQESLNFDAEWDYLLIFEHQQRQLFEELTTQLQLPSERVIYVMDMESWRHHPEAGRRLLRDSSLFCQYTSPFRRTANFLYEQTTKEFITCSVDGVSYIATSDDDEIMRFMFVERKNFAQDEMLLFHQLTQEYYSLGTKPGWFLDLGANIGTTCIYFKKKLDHSVNILAFEPDSMNYRLLLANLLLNGITDGVIAENLGLSDKPGHQRLFKNISNPGGNSILFYDEGPSEQIELVNLDDYLRQAKIGSEDIKYIWIDTEGFEANVIVGAENLLRDRAIPVFMELNPAAWKKSGTSDKMMACLSDCYSRYILIPEAKQGITRKHDIQELWQYLETETQRVGLGDIFLIK